MTIYTVQGRPDAAGTLNPDRFVFIKEGFSWPALIVPELWLLYRRMWLVFLLFVAGSVALAWLASIDELGIVWPAMLVARLLFATEANGLRRWTLERRGHAFLGVADGSRLREAEYRFFSGWVARRVAPVPAVVPAPVTPAAAAPTLSTETPAVSPPPIKLPPATPLPGTISGTTPGTTEVVGLFPAPGAGS